jgi:hypothetical protein
VEAVRRSLGEGGPFFTTLIRHQVVEKRRYGGSIKANSVVRDPFRKEQLLQPLLVVKRRLDPQVRGTRKNAFREGQDALYVEFVDGLGVVVDLGERQLLAEPVALPFVARRVDALREEECFVQAIELLLDNLTRFSCSAVRSFPSARRCSQTCRIRSLTSRM